MVEDIFDLRPGVLIKELKLRRPIFAKTASGGHFGREDPDFTWETPKIIDIKRWRDTRKV
jgi:S-adenosylmethionine synthetase